MALSLVTAATAEPVSLDEAKEHLRFDGHDQDIVIARLITAARQHAETKLRRQLVTATWRLSLDRFPPIDGNFNRVAQPPSQRIDLPLPPLQSVTSITYVDTNGDSQTWSSSEYSVDTYSQPGRITLAYGYSWPTTRMQANAVTIQYVAGYGAASAVPSSIKAAMLLLIGHWFENREAVNVGNFVNEYPMAVDSLLSAEDFGSYV